MQKSLMPKGVDHFTLKGAVLRDTNVQKSLMPKGVDHTVQIDCRDALEVVQKSLMPKGVDHLKLSSPPGGQPASAKIFDAERR